MADPLTRHVIARANEIMGFPRHLSQHVGGFVHHPRPARRARAHRQDGDGRPHLVEWDKDDIDALGIMKVDVLALGMLTCLQRGLRPAAHPVARSASAL
jgi:error-prone DNA polymerase